jgi:O-antigen/teichoic acid export membrane protein
MMAQYQKEGRPDKIIDLWHRATLKTAVLFFPVFVFLEVTAKPFITVLFTDQYSDATPIAMIYLLIFVRSTVETGSVLMTFKRTAFMFKVNLVGFLTHIGFCVLMFKMFGRLGIPFATVIVVYVQNAVNLYMGSILLNVPFRRVMPWRRLAGRFTIALIPGLLLGWGYRFYPVDGFIQLAGAGLIYFAVYFAVCFRLGVISLAEVKSIFGKV